MRKSSAQPNGTSSSLISLLDYLSFTFNLQARKRGLADNATPLASSNFRVHGGCENNPGNASRCPCCLRLQFSI